MSDVYKNRSVILTNNNQTVVYTVPTANADTIPKQKPVQALVSSIRACNKSGGALTLTLVNTDASLSADVTIINALSIASNTAVELLEKPLVLENSDVLKATASATGMDIIVSVLEIS
jgi:hypothetical protein|tara:strand:+ start:1632 stop:1985 length:354 start_codon:yes stop_codon:yes gene_type:complete